MKTIYQNCKEQLLGMAAHAKHTFPNDKPMIREAINNQADSLCKEYDLSEYHRFLLHSYACGLHPRTQIIWNFDVP